MRAWRLNGSRTCHIKGGATKMQVLGWGCWTTRVCGSVDGGWCVVCGLVVRACKPFNALCDHSHAQVILMTTVGSCFAHCVSRAQGVHMPLCMPSPCAWEGGAVCLLFPLSDSRRNIPARLPGLTKDIMAVCDAWWKRFGHVWANSGLTSTH